MQFLFQRSRGRERVPDVGINIFIRKFMAGFPKEKSAGLVFKSGKRSVWNL